MLPFPRGKGGLRGFLRKSPSVPRLGERPVSLLLEQREPILANPFNLIDWKNLGLSCLNVHFSDYSMAECLR
jgi:hypothetical protein